MSTETKSDKYTQLSMVSDTLTKFEAQVVMELRKLEAFGRIEITKDQNGAPNKFLVHTSVKKVIA